MRGGRPNGPRVNSQGREPLVAFWHDRSSSIGATVRDEMLELLSPRWGFCLMLTSPSDSRPWLLTLAALRLGKPATTREWAGCSTHRGRRGGILASVLFTPGTDHKLVGGGGGAIRRGGRFFRFDGF